MTRQAMSDRRKRAILGISDQLLFSGSNFAVTALAAATESRSDFGAFSLAMATYLLLTVVLRGLTSEPLVVSYSADEGVRRARAVNSGASAALALGIIGGAMVALASIATMGTLSHTLLALACGLAGLSIQDYLRYAALALARPGNALLNDGVQVAVQCGAIVALIHSGHSGVSELVLAWGLSSYAGALVAVITLRVRVSATGVVRWFRENGSLAWKFGLDDFVNQGSQQITSYVVAATAGLSAAGAFRGAQTIFGPAATLAMGVQSAATPELARSLDMSTRRLHRGVILVGVALMVVSVAWSAVALLLPGGIGRTLFGATWSSARPLLPWLAVAQAANSFRFGPVVGLRTLGDGKRTLRARFQGTIPAFVVQVFGAVAGGAIGVAIANAIARPAEATLWWFHYQASRRAYIPSNGQPRSSAPDEQVGAAGGA